jgi:hypothetical protein
VTGPTRDVSAHYLDRANKLYSPITWADSPRENSDEIQLLSVKMNQAGVVTGAIDCREPFTINIEYENKAVVRNSRLFIVIRNGKGEALFTTSDYDVPTDESMNRERGTFMSSVTVPEGLLKAGSYYGTVGADIKNERIIFAENDYFNFDVFESGDDTLAERHKRVGLIAPILSWQTGRCPR